MAGRVVHFEIPFDDAERASAFYGDAFGWNLTPLPEMKYVLVTTGPSDQGPPSEPGFINGGMMARGESPAPGPIVVIDVDSIERTLGTIEESGGSVVVPKEPVGDMGFAAYVTDPEGNVIGLWETAAPA